METGFKMHVQCYRQSVCLELFDFPYLFLPLSFGLSHFTVIPMNILVLLPSSCGCINAVSEVILGYRATVSINIVL